MFWETQIEPLNNIARVTNKYRKNESRVFKTLVCRRDTCKTKGRLLNLKFTTMSPIRKLRRHYFTTNYFAMVIEIKFVKIIANFNRKHKNKNK